MRILFIVAALFTLASCESMDFTSVTVSSGYNHYYPSGHISYTLGFYSGDYYNGYRVYGTYGYRYYHAPRHYAHHRHFVRPPVVHYHVHTSYCEHNYRPRNHNNQDRRNHNTQSYVQPQVRQTPRSTPPVRQTPPRQRDHRQNRREDRVVNNNQRQERVVNTERRENRQDRRRDQKRKRK